jgi:hypothetical protein
MPTTIETIVIILVVLIGAALGTYAIAYQSTPTSIVPMNITIVEKYPVHTYQSGKYTEMDPPKIVDDKGDLYIVQSENDWAKMQINKTYNVMYASYPNAQKGKIVGINY